MENRYSHYFLMNEEEIGLYVKEKCRILKKESPIKVTEIGNGNINYVFLVMDVDTKQAFIVKQAGLEARISKEMKLELERGKREAAILKIYGQIVPGYVPRIYYYDETMCTIIMEYMKDYTVLREALMKFMIYPNFAEQISTFLARTLFFLSDLYLNHSEKKKMAATYTNVDLCNLTEELVFTDPYYNGKQQNSLTNNQQYLKEMIYDNEELQLEVADLKFRFMTNQQALLHGDLHTGSVFIHSQGICVFDPEFTFFGPMGYDIGNICAHFLIQLCRLTILQKYCLLDKKTNIIWIYNSIGDIIDLFRTKFLKLMDSYTREVMAKTPGFKEKYIEKIIQDTVGYAGIECIRRAVGLAKVEELSSLSDDKVRADIEKCLLEISIKMILERKSIHSGIDIKELIGNQLMLDFF
ncbi:S-methyl-5-thioribose kinase [Anaerosporobacter sp.]